MKLYLITPRIRPLDDECWGDAVVAATDINTAKEIHPCDDSEVIWDDDDETWGDPDDDCTWVPPYQVLAEEIGKASEHVESGVVLARWSDPEANIP